MYLLYLSYFTQHYLKPKVSYVYICISWDLHVFGDQLPKRNIDVITAYLELITDLKLNTTFSVVITYRPVGNFYDVTLLTNKMHWG